MKGWATVARVGSIGDNLMAASVCAPLKRMGYMVEVITSEPNHVVFFHNPHVDKLSVIDQEKDLPRDNPIAWQKWFQDRGKQSDCFVHLSHSCESRHALMPQMSSFWWPAEVRRKICAGSYLETAHDIAGVPHSFGPLFYCSEAEYELALETRAGIGAPLIGWVLSGSRFDRRYPYASQAIARLIREFGFRVMMIGTPAQDSVDEAKAILSEVEKYNGNADGLALSLAPNSAAWPLRRALSQLLVCDLVIGPDTGPMWAVALEAMPKVIMLSNSSPENVTKHWRNTLTLHAAPDNVPCFPCHRLHSDKSTCKPNREDNGPACMADISVECLVTAAARGMGDVQASKRMALEFAKHTTNWH